MNIPKRQGANDHHHLLLSWHHKQYGFDYIRSKTLTSQGKNGEVITLPDHPDHPNGHSVPTNIAFQYVADCEEQVREQARKQDARRSFWLVVMAGGIALAGSLLTVVIERSLPVPQHEHSITVE
jgi:hypothetical protein